MDAFDVDRPSGNGLPPEWSAAANGLVDHGRSVLQQWDKLRPKKTLRDAVLAAFVRRSLITAEAINTLALRRLLEPTYASYRTLVDLELKMLYVVSDASDLQAAKVVVHQYDKTKSVGTAILKDQVTRVALEEYPDVLSTLRADLSLLKKAYGADQFDAVRAELEKNPSWHGQANTEAAFRNIGAIRSYTQEFMLTSEYVHGENPDRDFVMIGGTLSIAPLCTIDDYLVGKILGMTAAKLVSVLVNFASDRPILDVGTEVEALLSMRNPVVRELIAESTRFLSVFERFLGPRKDVVATR
jgi:hypothetical protein